MNQLQVVQETCVKTMKSISDKMNELQSLSKKVDNHESRIKLLEKENATLKTTVKSLVVRLDNGEQRCNANKIQINCVPFTPFENLKNIVTDIGHKLNVNIAESDIVEIIRIKNKNNSATQKNTTNGSSNASNSTNIVAKINNPIIIHFKSSELSKSFIESYRSNKSVLFFDDNNKIKIYINEFLTSNRKRLLYRAKLFGKSNGYKYIWTKGGNIYMRKNDGESVYASIVAQILQTLALKAQNRQGQVRSLVSGKTLDTCIFFIVMSFLVYVNALCFIFIVFF